MNRISSRGWLTACGCAVGAAASVGWQIWKNTAHSNSALSDPSPLGFTRAKCNTSFESDSTPEHTLSCSRVPPLLMQDENLRRATERSRTLVTRAMLEQGIPGAVVAVAKNGKVVWSEGLGYADIENDVHCSPNTVMRIASISKPLTAVALFQLWQKGLVDLDAPIQEYVPTFPHKKFEGKPVSITTRLLLSHLAGIRHYDKHAKKGTQRSGEVKNEQQKLREFDHEEYFITSHFDSVEESLRLFADDELISEPGKAFNYTTHGWTLISAMIEKASGESFLNYMKDHVFGPLGMTSTRAEFHQPLVYHRARHYVRDQNGCLKNTAYLDNSYKWAGGGFISNAEDLVQFGNAMLTCYQLPEVIPAQKSTSDSDSPIQSSSQESRTVKGILDHHTVIDMWKPVVTDIRFSSRGPLLDYGMGWLMQQKDGGVVGGKAKPFCVGHTGGAVGASSVLLIVPQDPHEPGVSSADALLEESKPCGVVVAVVFNLQEVRGMFSLGQQIADAFLQL